MDGCTDMSWSELALHTEALLMFVCQLYPCWVKDLWSMSNRVEHWHILLDCWQLGIPAALCHKQGELGPHLSLSWTCNQASAEHRVSLWKGSLFLAGLFTNLPHSSTHPCQETFWSHPKLTSRQSHWNIFTASSQQQTGRRGNIWALQCRERNSRTTSLAPAEPTTKHSQDVSPQSRGEPHHYPSSAKPFSFSYWWSH